MKACTYVNTYEINFLYFEGGSPELCDDKWLLWKDKLPRALEGQWIGTSPNLYNFTKRLSTSDAKSIFNHAALDISKCTVDNCNKRLQKMIKHAFSSNTSCAEQYPMPNIGQHENYFILHTHVMSVIVGVLGGSHVVVDNL